MLDGDRGIDSIARADFSIVGAHPAIAGIGDGAIELICARFFCHGKGCPKLWTLTKSP
jgi:hypothetical protein